MQQSAAAAFPLAGLEGFESTLPRSFVHRLAVSEVYLMRSERRGANQFDLTAQWPRRHFYYRVERGMVDPILVAETLRQATIFVAHEYYGVPLDHRFLMNRMQVSVQADSVAVASKPPEITLRVNVGDVRSGLSGATRLQTNVDFTCGDIFIGSGVGELQVVDGRVYERMRSGYRHSERINPPDPCGPDELLAQGVALHAIGTELAWILVVDQSHPVFFDHSVDHVPGILVVEAARQAVAEAVGTTDVELTGFDGRYFRFLDLGHPSLLRLESWESDGRGGGEGRLTLSQDNVEAVDVHVEARSRCSSY